MALYFGNNQIATNGNYAKFGENNLTSVKYGTTEVWTKSTGTTYTVTLSATGGTWNKSSITGIASGTSISFNASTKTLTVGTQTAKFTPYYTDEVEHYNYSSITNASGNITSNRTVTATATPAYQEWTGQVDIDGIFVSQDSISLGSYSKVKIFYDVLAYGNESGDIDFYDEELTFIMNLNGDEYLSLTNFDDLGYGELDMYAYANNGSVSFATSRAYQGQNGITVFECWRLYYL